MVEDTSAGHEGNHTQDGFEATVSALRAQSIELIGTLEVINQQASLFKAEYEPGDSKRVIMIKLLAELTAKVSKLDSAASKIMNIIFIGDSNDNTSHLQSPTEQPSTDSL